MTPEQKLAEVARRMAEVCREHGVRSVAQLPPEAYQALLEEARRLEAR